MPGHRLAVIISSVGRPAILPAYGRNMTVQRRVLARTRIGERLPLYGYIDSNIDSNIDRAGPADRAGRVRRSTDDGEGRRPGASGSSDRR